MVVNVVSVSGEHFYQESGAVVVVASGTGVTIQSGVGFLVSGQVIHAVPSDGVDTASLVEIKNLNVEILLDRILKELKKINVQLSLLTDEEIKHSEIG